MDFSGRPRRTIKRGPRGLMSMPHQHMAEKGVEDVRRLLDNSKGPRMTSIQLSGPCTFPTANCSRSPLYYYCCKFITLGHLVIHFSVGDFALILAIGGTAARLVNQSHVAVDAACKSKAGYGV